MRIQPLAPETLGTELRFVHDEIASLIGKSQKIVRMTDANGALLGPFAPMLHFPQFGVPALNFLRSLDSNATLCKSVREIAILTVGATYGAKFELYAHEIMAESLGISSSTIATLAAGGYPSGLTEQETVAHNIAAALGRGRIVPDSTYQESIKQFGKKGTAELIFLIGGYCLIAMVLNGFDIPAPSRD